MPSPIKAKGSLLDRLRTVKTDLVTLKVYTADDDEPRECAVPNVRQRWQRVGEVLDDLQWTKVEACDKKGNILLVHNRNALDERPAGDLEDVGIGGTTGRAGEVSALLGASVHWVLKAQDVVLSRHTEATAAVTDASNRLIDSTMKRFEQMDRQYNEMLRLNHAMHGERFASAERALREAASVAAEDRESSSDKLIEAFAPAFAKAVLAKPDAPPAGKTNGTPTKKAPVAQ
jgi:hypothetical protein